MTLSRRLTLALLCCAILFTAVYSIQATASQDRGGSYSSVTPLSEKSRQWFLDQFGQEQSLVNLLHAVNRFACENFRYTDQEYFLIQTFDLNKFLFETPYEGVCFEFACFLKCAVVVWAEHHGRTDIRCYVYSVKLSDGSHHAVNFIYEGETLYFIDITDSSTRAQRGEKKDALYRVNITAEAFLDKANWEVEAIN